MGDGLRRRVLEMVAAEYRAHSMPPLRTVGVDLRGYLEVSVQKPALYVVSGDGGTVGREHGDGVVEIMPFWLHGYVMGPSGEPDGVMAAREDLYQTVLRALYADTMRERWITDAAAHNGNGCSQVWHVEGPVTDKGLSPPQGGFILPCVARLHYKPSSY